MRPFPHFSGLSPESKARTQRRWRRWCSPDRCSCLQVACWRCPQECGLLHLGSILRVVRHYLPFVNIVSFSVTCIIIHLSNILRHLVRDRPCMVQLELLVPFQSLHRPSTLHHLSQLSFLNRYCFRQWESQSPVAGRWRCPYLSFSPSLTNKWSC